MSKSRIKVKLFFPEEIDEEQNQLTLTVKEPRKVYHETDDDISSVAMFYALIHDYAAKHSDAVITITSRERKARNLTGLIEVFSRYPYLLPDNVTLAFHDQVTKETIAGNGPVDEAYMNNAAYLISLARLQGETSDHKVNTALSVDFNEFIAYRAARAGEKALPLILDADNCIYNAQSKLAKIIFVAEHAVAIKKFIDAPATDEVTSFHFIAKLHDAIDQIDFDAFSNPEHDEATNTLCEEKIKYLEEQCDVYDADLVEAKKMHRAPFMLVLTQYIRYLNRISPDLVAHILYRANQELFIAMTQRAVKDKCRLIILLTGSCRQSHHENYLHSVKNGTGLFIEDLHALTRYLNGRNELELPFMLDRFLLADAYSGHRPGTSFRRSLSQQEDHPFSVYDKSKLPLVIGLAHHIKDNYPGVKHGVFCDDLHQLFLKYKHIFNERGFHGYLPREFVLYCMTYDGEFAKDVPTVVIGGSGDIKTDIYAFLRDMAHHAGVDLQHARQKQVEIDFSKRFNFATFGAPEMPLNAPLDDAPQPAERVVRWGLHRGLFRPVGFVMPFDDEQKRAGNRVNKLN